MSKFKIGDSVRILDGENIPEYTGGWTSGMANYIGEVHKITGIDTDWRMTDATAYRLGCDGEDCASLYWWDERGLELAESEREEDDEDEADEISEAKKIAKAFVEVMGLTHRKSATKELATHLWEIYEAFLEVGFASKQAFQLTTLAFKTVSGMKGE